METVNCPECDAVSTYDIIHLHSGFDSDGRAFIHLAWGKGTDLRVEFTPDELRQRALGLLAAAEVAEQDSSIVRYFMSTGRSFEEAAEFVFTLRQFRDELPITDTSDASS